MIKRLLVPLGFAFLLACGGGGGSSSSTGSTGPSNPPPPPPPPPLTTGQVGVFRDLKGTAVPGRQTLTNTSVTMHPRAFHRSILMTNGKVLIMGGDLGLNLFAGDKPSIDIFDPVAETFTTSAAHPMAIRHHQEKFPSQYDDFCLLNLPDGRVAIIGARDYTGGLQSTGGDGNNESLASQYIEIYDPVSDSLSYVQVNDPTGHCGSPSKIGPSESAYYLGNGNIMVHATEGFNYFVNYQTGALSLASTGTGFYSDAPGVEDGKGDVWVIGGRYAGTGGLADTRIYKFDHTTSEWNQVAALPAPRADSALVYLGGNKIGVYGGYDDQFNPSASAYIFDTTDLSVTPASDMTGARYSAAGVLLQSGYSLIAGGIGDANGTPVDSEVIHRYDSTVNFSGTTGGMVHPRSHHTVTNLPNGLVLIAGGGDPTTVANTAEIFDPQQPVYVQYTTDSMVAGQTQTFASTYAAGVNWSSSDTSVLTVDPSTGTVTAVGLGSALVTATAKDDSTKTAVVPIKVTPQ